MNRLVTTVLVTAGNHAITWLSKDGNTENVIHTVLSAAPAIEGLGSRLMRWLKSRMACGYMI